MSQTHLPIDAHLPNIVVAMRDSRRLVLVAEPGAGKTTRVPPAILRANLLDKEHPNLVMLQPRRVAARAAAQRIADENGWRVGEQVGYHVRFEKQIGRNTRLRVLTEGILTRQLIDDPFIEGIGGVILDEFHERSLHTDTVIALLNEIRQTVRPDLLICVMSATLDAEPVATFLDGCPVLRVPGRTFPVEIEQVGTMRDQLYDRVAETVRHAIKSGPDSGDVLVFMPGAEEIRRTITRLQGLSDEHDLLLLPLHGSLPFEEQVRALRPARQRKVVVATNIAETSLTIDGVRTIIDSGLVRIAEYDPERGLDRLELRRLSKASAAQRAGRAGRTAPGRCVRLWSAKEQHALDDFELPEILRVDLAATVLALHAWGRPDPRNFPWYESPSEETLAAAERLLAMLGALSAETNGQITPLGRKMLSLPVHPRLARLLVAAMDQDLLDAGATVAAILSEKDFLDTRPIGGARGPATTGRSDLIVRLHALEMAEQSRFAAYLREDGIDPVAARQVAITRDELLRIVGSHAIERHDSDMDENALLQLALLAYPDRVCRRRANDPMTGTMVGGTGVRLAPESIVHEGDFFLALDARHDHRAKARQAMTRIASVIELPWLENLFPQSIRVERKTEFDETRQRVVGSVRVYYRDLVLRDEAHATVDAAEARQVLADALQPRALEIFAGDEEAAAVLARVALLRKHLPEHSWPAFDAGELGDILAVGCEGKRSIEDLRRANLAELLMAHLSYPLDRLLEQHAPASLEVPTGNRIRIDYSETQPPVLAVRLQELFGMPDTPKLASGRVPLTLHLLGPNFRPVQITSDLASFWKNTYPQVRKDLRARYPKHSWPDDPLTANPQAKGGRRRRN
jgi:ATP-dependent helicase HrpB